MRLKSALSPSCTFPLLVLPFMRLFLFSFSSLRSTLQNPSAPDRTEIQTRSDTSTRSRESINLSRDSGNIVSFCGNLRAATSPAACMTRLVSILRCVKNRTSHTMAQDGHGPEVGPVGPWGSYKRYSSPLSRAWSLISLLYFSRHFCRPISKHATRSALLRDRDKTQSI